MAGSNIWGDTSFADLASKNANADAYKQYGLDPKGNNEFGAIIRRSVPAIGENFWSRVAFQNQLEPGRQDSIRGLISQFAPGNVQSGIDAQRALLARQGAESADMARARVAGYGGSTEAQIAAALAARNQEIEAANQYQNYMYSPEGQAARAAAQMQGYGYASDLGLANMMPLFSAVETRNQQNQAEKQAGGLGALGGVLGGIVGNATNGINWNSVFGIKSPGVKSA